MASLVVIEGPAQGSHFPLTQPLVSVGRDDTCTFQVLDPLVSRSHLQVRLDDKLGKHVAADYRSANGVLVNDKQVLMPTPLSDGDRIKIGHTTLMYLTVDHPDAPAALAAAKKKGEWKRSTLMGRESG
jgi:pSer/pThr/pTyr-binding forkhead associated (FHA) protein